MADNKDKKVLNVPHLRFPEFCGEWEETTLGKISEITKGSGISKDQLSEQGSPCILYGELYTKYKSEIIDEVYSRTELDSSSLVKSKANDVIIPCSGETAIDISTARCVPFNNILLGGDLNIIRLNQDDGGFFAYQLNGARKKDIARVAQGVSVVHLYGENLKHIRVYHPVVEEQKKITRLLSLIDERIATQNKIIEDLKKLKSAISKQAFAQKPNGWNRLDTLFSKGKAGGTPTSTNKEYYNGEIPFLSINDITKQGKYVRYTENHLSRSGLENSSAWVVPEYSLIISMYASVGLVTINEVPITTSQAMFAMHLRDKDLLDYLYYYLSYFKYRHIHKYLETGTQSNINADIVRGIMIPTYGHSRNMKIASTLQSIDAEIDNELSVLKLFNRQKNYLLSQMFI
ncbi:restriction endonuclease subunit S [Bacteroides xylanisolvens]|uniref:restriction endonuclease subunit S n=2 Tax=Bacteroides xylanisolvens TaxID=371601 RepID=UPI0010EC079E|nr:restriction endonuclease subunit S [Bacteroides xylanisolvens]KAB6097238.1 restriction endonuclease subunit S [Bacteroides xylanisolvens]KAB6112880.1 restriction endonuclease subunit S [Bacteroides xylanisolvens]RYT18855.1 restriction endonuclease subunit S [Bacteroides xylanisolvens]